MRPVVVALGALMTFGAAAQPIAVLLFSDAETRSILAHGPWPPPSRRDPSNRVSGNKAAIALGAELFREPRLSGNGAIACATCHRADRGFGDGLPKAQGLATVDRDPVHLLGHHGIGMTDLVKRATAKAAELRPEEYRDGLARLERLCAWLQPAAVCVIGLTGWRHAVDRRAVAGEQPGTLGGRPVWLMPNPSGLNAHVTVGDLAGHLRAAASLADTALAGTAPSDTSAADTSAADTSPVGTA